MISVLKTNPETGMLQIPEYVIADLKRNNTAFPEPVKVIYNLKTEEVTKIKDDFGKTVKTEVKRLEHPILATTVYFCDGTKVTVTNSANDYVKTEMKSYEVPAFDENGAPIIREDGKTQMIKAFEVEVATHESKEIGLCYCLVKRLHSREDEDGNFIGDGLGRQLNDWVTGAYDQNFDRKRYDANAAIQAKYNALRARKPRKTNRRPSLAKSVDRLAAVVEQLEARVAKMA